MMPSKLIKSQDSPPRASTPNFDMSRGNELNSEDILSDSLEFLGGPTLQDSDTVQYGPLLLSVAPKVRQNISSSSRSPRSKHTDPRCHRKARYRLPKLHVKLCCRQLTTLLWQANTLLADHLFSPSFFLAERIERNLLSAANSTVIELGAGAALPSILLSTQHNPPSLVVITDYPDDGILGNLLSNVNCNREHINPACAVHALGYAWGADPQRLLDLLPDHSTGYDTIILSDLVHFDSFHDILLQSIALLLSKAETARLHVAAGKYTQPHVCDTFLTKAKALGLILEEREPKPDEQGWLGSFQVSGFDHHALALRKAACRYWIGHWEQNQSA